MVDKNVIIGFMNILEKDIKETIRHNQAILQFLISIKKEIKTEGKK